MAINDDLTKKPYLNEEVTDDKLRELRRCTIDPSYFARNYCYIRHPTKGRTLLDLYDYQEELINSYHNYRLSISLLARQTGKSTCAAAYILWYAMFKGDSLILVASNKLSSALEIMTYIRFMYELCPDHIRAGATKYGVTNIEFDNGSRILAEATTATTGRGKAVSVFYLDEMGFVAPGIVQEFWTSISPTISTGGRCIITSTPNQDGDLFAQLWRQANKRIDEYGNETEVGINGFRPYMATWDAHPDRDEKWAAQERQKVGEELFRREHECVVHATRLKLFDGNAKFEQNIGDLFESL